MPMQVVTVSMMATGIGGGIQLHDCAVTVPLTKQSGVPLALMSGALGKKPANWQFVLRGVGSGTLFAQVPLF